MLRHIDGPPKEWSSAAEAAEWLGLERKHFQVLAGREDWLRPSYFGRLPKYHWQDLVAFSRVYQGRAGKEPDDDTAVKPAEK